jgi:hypothetical protein
MAQKKFLVPRQQKKRHFLNLEFFMQAIEEFS